MNKSFFPGLTAINKARFALYAVIALATFATPAALLSQQSDEGAIRDVQQAQADAWNKHDARAYANLFTEDGDVVNVLGWLWHGRPEIERNLTGAFAQTFRESTLTITGVDVKFLTPDIAVAHVRWTMAGAKMPPGIPAPRAGIQLVVVTKNAGRWLIASFQNTNSVPERAFLK